MRRSIVLAFLGAMVLWRTAAADTACESNFDSGGSLRKGRWVKTYLDFPQVTVGTAVDRLAKQLPMMQLQILNVDADNGVINTRTILPSSAGFPEDFTVAPLGGGSRVTVVLTLPLLAYLMPPAVYRPQLCGALTLAGIEVPGGGGGDQPPQAAPPTPPASDDPPPQGEPPPYEPQGAQSPPAAVQAPAQPEEAPLTNDEIVQLSQAGLGSDVIVAKINEAGSESFDLSTRAMIELRRKKVSQKVIAAMLQRHANGQPAAGSGPPGRQR